MASGKVRVNGKCDECGAPFTAHPLARGQRFCSAVCRIRQKSRLEPEPKVAERRKRWLQTDNGKASQRRRAMRYHNRNPIKARARRRLDVAVRNGSVQVSSLCSECGKPPGKRRLHGHHEDYAKPLEVVWLCPRCHWNRHHATSC